MIRIGIHNSQHAGLGGCLQLPIIPLFFFFILKSCLSPSVFLSLLALGFIGQNLPGLKCLSCPFAYKTWSVLVVPILSYIYILILCNSF